MGAIGPRSSVSAPKAKARRHLQARKYLLGERYGGFRGPRIRHYLQAQLGVAMKGVVLVSPYLNPTLDDNGDVSPLAWMLRFPRSLLRSWSARTSSATARCAR